ncbi:hypothetical protein LQ367_12925 [Halorubrum lacusprofundi]|nr:hypothetical protein [Halorubrum lacusprofundi]
MSFELVVGRSSAVLTVESLRRRYRRRPAVRVTLTCCRGQRHRWDQPHLVVGVVDDLSETRLVTDAVPTLIVEPRRGLFLALRRFLPAPLSGPGRL